MLKNLNLKKIPFNQRSQVLGICRHEAGHYIAAKLLGFNTGNISIEIYNIQNGHRASSEVTLRKKTTTIEEIVDYLKTRVVVLYSGVFAESLTNNQVDNTKALEYIKKGGEHDYMKVRELIHLLRNIEFPDSISAKEMQNNLDEIENKLWNKAAEFVTKEYEKITKLGAFLDTKIIFLGEEVVIKSEEIENFLS